MLCRAPRAHKAPCRRGSESVKHNHYRRRGGGPVTVAHYRRRAGGNETAVTLPRSAAEIAPARLHERDDDERRRLGAQDARPEADDRDARRPRGGDLVAAEAAFGTDEDRGLGEDLRGRADGRERRGVGALIEEQSELGAGGGGDGFRKGLRLGDDRHGRAPALLGGGDGDPRPALALRGRDAGRADRERGAEGYDRAHAELGRLL